MLLSLTGFCIVVSAALGMMNEITKEPIAKAEVDAKVTAIKQVVNAFDNNPYEERFEVDVDERAYRIPGQKRSGNSGLRSRKLYRQGL